MRSSSPSGPTQTDAVTSASRGNASLHRRRWRLDQLATALPPPPRDKGRVRLLSRRLHGGLRDHPARVRLDVSAGMPGDAWGRRFRRKPANQLTLIRHDLARLIANGQPLGLFGDNLFVDLDLSSSNLPPGSRLRLGGALLEVTAKPHNGCRKFKTRFGADALAFVQDPATRHENRRGIHCRVVESGEVEPGDPVVVVARGASR